MKLSVIVPAHKAERTLPRTLESLNAAAKAWSAATGLPPAEAEIIVSWDPERKGPSWGPISPALFPVPTPGIRSILQVAAWAGKVQSWLKDTDL